MSLLQRLAEMYGSNNVSKLESKEVFRCLKKDSTDRLYEIHYIDFSDKWMGFDLDEYYEIILNKDYYSSDGYLQWNFYYYFISDEPQIKLKSKIKREIEKNESYARKYVLTWADFVEMQQAVIAIGKIDSNKIEKDLYSTWLDELRRLDLHFVYNEKVKNFKKAIEDYLKGVPSFQTEIDVSNISDDSIENLNHIRELRLDGYREYPVQKNFTLGQVVLGYGANATGKTSFLDAIEMIITGNCNRQERPPAYNISFTDDKDNVYTHSDRLNPYKNRDEKWYKSYSTRGHNLNGNFNRFNYFTSDAAYELKKQDDNQSASLEKIIADIALGQEVNMLEEKILGFKKRFEEHNRDYNKDLFSLNNEIKSRELEIESITKKSTKPLEYRDKLIQDILERGWLLQLGIEENEFQKETATQIQIVDECLKKLSNPFITTNKITKETVVEGTNRLKQLSIQIQTRKEKLHDLKLKQREVQSTYRSTIARNALLVELEKYYIHPSIHDLIGLGRKMQELEKLLMNMQTIQEKIDEVPLTDQFVKAYERFSVFEIDELVTDRRNLSNLLQQETQKNIQELEDGISRLNQILTDIKSSGNEFLQLDPYAKQCPLCGTDFERNQLIHAIEETKSHLSSAKALQNLKHQREQNRTIIVSLEFESIIVQGLKEICTLNNDYNSLELGDLLKQILTIPDNISNLNQQIFNLGAARSFFELENLNEDEFSKLKREWILLTGLEIDNSIIHQIRVEMDSASTVERGLIDDYSEAIANSEYEISKLYTSELTDDMEIASEMFRLVEALNHFKTLELFISVSDKKDLHEYLTDLSYIQASYNLYKSVYNENQIANSSVIALQQTIRTNLEKIAEIKPQQQKAEEAFLGLDLLLKKFNKNDFLKEYINNNRKEIVDIFKLIHSPKEFQDININGNKLFLLSEGDTRTLDEISTGQRAALAISIFLSLNKKLQNGPGMILLDDPIAYVDDLNILSFLDYLRALVLNSNKQIIFVTANSDLAFLFKMKFQFLTDEKFTVIKFERNDVA